MNRAKHETFWFWAVLVAAAALRLTGIGFSPYHPDEHVLVNYSLSLGTGDLNPHRFYAPSFIFYNIFLADACFYVVGKLLGLFHSAGSFLEFYLRTPVVLYVVARLVSVIYGVLTVWVVYRIGRAWHDRRTGLIAALFLAVSALHVRDSHFITFDPALIFYMTLAFFFAIRFEGSNKTRHLFYAAMATGFAASIKYNGVVAALPALLALGLQLRAKPLRCLLREGFMFGVLLLGAFFAGSPFILLDYGSAFPQIIHQLFHVNATFHISWAYPAEVILFSAGLPAVALAGFGCFVERNNKNLLLLSIAAVYYILVVRMGQPFERYALPLLPFVSIAAALGLRALPISRKVSAMVCALSLLPGLALAIHTDRLLLRTDTRDLAKRWIADHVRPGETLVIDNSMRAPALQATRQQLREKLDRLSTSREALAANRTRKLKTFYEMNPYPTPAYRLYYLGREEDAEFSSQGPYVSADVASLKAIGAQYIVTDALSEGERGRFYPEIGRFFKTVATFDPGGDALGEKTLWTYLPADYGLLFRRRPGPAVLILKRVEEA